MTKLRSYPPLYATICTVLAFAMMVGAVAYGSNFHGASPPPDGDGNGGNIYLSHGASPPPDGDGNGGNIYWAHGASPPPDGDGNGGNIIL